MAHILLGVTGSIAAFKACHLASDWSKQGHEVRVAMTAAAQEFVTPLTFSSLTHTQTRTSMFAAQRNDGDVAHTPSDPLHINHVDDAKWADMLVIAPASADIIAKIACGIADDQLTSTVIAYSEGPKILCPAMNVHMYENAVTQRNLNTCRELGWTIVEPESGMLACGDVGSGRLPDEGVLVDYVLRELACAKDLKGKKVVVSAGATQEPMDPVRYLTNHSTGKMGYAVARACMLRGADVTLLASTGCTLPPVPFVKTVPFTTAADLFEAVKANAMDADALVMAAAVADYRPATVAADKVKKHDGEMNIALERTDDILAWVGAHKPEKLFVCGFSMETRDLIENSTAKLHKKNMDMIVANNLKVPGAGFGVDTNVVTIITAQGTTELPLQSKDAVAGHIADAIAGK